MGKDDDHRDNTGYDLVNAEEICDTIDTIMKRHEADYTRLYVELDELFKNKDASQFPTFDPIPKIYINIYIPKIYYVLKF